MGNFPKIRTSDTTFDKIFAYYKNPDKIKLSPKQEEIKNRWLTLFTLRTNFYSRLQAINAYREQQLKVNNIEISQAQAYRDMSNAERLFGSIHKADKQASLVILAEYAHKNLLMAIKQKNPIAVTAALTKLEKYLEIDKTEDVHFNPAKLEDKPDKFVIPKEVLEAVSNHFKIGVVDFNKLEVEDITAETVEDVEEK